jgi:hypothetical protein
MATAEERDRFLRMAWPHALAVAQQTGMDPRVVVAQAGLETGWGTAVPGNNYFGIKGGSGPALATKEAGPDGKLVPTTAQFQEFKDPAESFAAYANHPIIQTVGKLPYSQQAAALQANKYATAPDYGQKVSQIAGGLTMPTDVQPSTLPLPGQTVAGPGPAAAAPTPGLLANGQQDPHPETGVFTAPYAPAEVTGQGAAPVDASGPLSGATPNSYGALGSGLMAAGTSLMKQQPQRQSLLAAKESFNAPQAQAQGNPSYAQSAAQLALLRRLRQQQEE